MKKLLLGLLLISGLQIHAQNLNKYLELAAQNNPKLNSKYKLYLAALEKVDQNGSLPDPTLSFGYFISPVETRVGPQNMRFSLSQMFPWMGTRAVRKQVASSWAKAMFEEFQEEKSKLFLAVQSKWLKLYELGEEIKIHKQNLKFLQSYEPITQTKYESNLVSLTDLVRVQIQIQEAQTELELFRINQEIARGEFNELLNRPLSMGVNTEIAVIESPFIDPESDSLKMNQPQLKAAQERLNALNYQLELTKLQRRPNLGVGLDYALVGKRNDVSIPDNGKDILMPMVSFSLPVFGKKNRALQQEAMLQKESTELEIVSIKNSLLNEWRKTELSASYASKQLSLYEKEIEKTELLLRVLTSEYTNANTSFEELLLTQQKLLLIKLAEVKARVNLQQVSFQKQYLTGYHMSDNQEKNEE